MIHTNCSLTQRYNIQEFKAQLPREICFLISYMGSKEKKQQVLIKMLETLPQENIVIWL